ncbi:MAG TPA: thioredoxin domain-containing protein [Vicinamibacterales bacterium]|nr:thioredoxin domain-containing protein [Vicinamibacterales bacterium]
MTVRRAVVFVAGALVAGIAVIAPGAAAGQAGQAGRRVAISAAVPDAGAGTVAITGENFGFVPFVTLDLIPLTIESVGGNRIIVAAPIKLMPAKTYLLTLSYGPAAEESASIPVVLGGEPGAGTETNPSPAAAPVPSGDQAAAKVGDRVITIGEVDREWRRSDPATYFATVRELYNERRRVLDTIVGNELLAREAAARGMTVDALLAEEIPKRRIAMPDAAVRSLYESLGDRTRGASLDQMRPALRAWLERMTEPEIARMSYVEELMKVSTRADVLLEPPRVQVKRTAQDATLGPDGALVEIVAFGDFQSAPYARFAQAFGKVRDTFGDRVRFRFKNLAMLGAASAAAAEGAQCAKAQGRFWAYHDALLAQAGALDAARLRQTATDAGLDRETFGSCLDRGDYRDVTRQAANEAGEYGITSSPSFLINGRLAPDPPPFLPPFDFFKRIIEEELSKLARKP